VFQAYTELTKNDKEIQLPNKNMTNEEFFFIAFAQVIIIIIIIISLFQALGPWQR